jgi:hypothetical protein
MRPETKDLYRWQKLAKAHDEARRMCLQIFRRKSHGLSIRAQLKALRRINTVGGALLDESVAVTRYRDEGEL